MALCKDCKEYYEEVVMADGQCAYCLLKQAFQLMKNAAVVGAGEASIYAERARQAIYFGKDPHWPSRWKS